jgi:hypothetical protein
VLMASTPLPEAMVSDPIAVVPSLKLIVPVAEAGVTVAVRVIACPDTAVAAEAAKVTAVVVSGAVLTWTETALEVDAPSALSPA